MTNSKKTSGQTNEQTLFHMTLPVTTGVQKLLFILWWKFTESPLSGNTNLVLCMHFLHFPDKLLLKINITGASALNL